MNMWKPKTRNARLTSTTVPPSSTRYQKMVNPVTPPSPVVNSSETINVPSLLVPVEKEPPLLFFVIYSCKKNLEKAQILYQYLKDKFPFFTFFILYGDPRLKEEYQVSPPFLVVKSGDHYEHLANKTQAMIRAISKLSYGENYRGVLKCDDDIFPNLKSLQSFYEFLVTSETNIPYAGVLEKIISDKLMVSRSHFDKCSSPKYNIPQPVIHNLIYASGPMYYLSISSVLQLERVHRLGKLPLVFYEDMMIGYHLAEQGIYPTPFPLYQNAMDVNFKSPSIQNLNSDIDTLYVVLHGGLGNQMFQLAAGYGIARKTNRYLVALYSNRKEQYPHQSDIHAYTHSLFRTIPCQMITPELFKDKVTEMYSEIGEVSKGFQYHPELLDTTEKKTLVLNGYFQNEKYFREVREELIAEWKHPLLIEKLHETYPNLAQSYFFHIRRGDYLQNPLYQIAWDEYYSTAIDTILELETSSETIQFYVFSNDNEFCKSYPLFSDYLKRYPKITFTLIENLGAVESLMFMSQCSNGGITSNSTFSWWAGYLNPRPDKLVILPKRWLNSDEFSDIDMRFDGAISL